MPRLCSGHFCVMPIFAKCRGRPFAALSIQLREKVVCFAQNHYLLTMGEGSRIIRATGDAAMQKRTSELLARCASKFARKSLPAFRHAFGPAERFGRGDIVAGHGRTSWDDVALVTVSVLRGVARREKQDGAAVCLSRREIASMANVSEYRAHAAVRRLVGSGLISSEARYRSDGGRLANALHVTEAGRAFLSGLE